MSYKTFAPLRNVLCGLSHRTAVLVQGVFVSPLTCIYHFFCFLMTIGTTGRPKGVTISHSALVVQSLAKIAIVGYGEDDVCLSTMIKHDMNVSTLI